MADRDAEVERLTRKMEDLLDAFGLNEQLAYLCNIDTDAIEDEKDESVERRQRRTSRRRSRSGASSWRWALPVLLCELVVLSRLTMADCR